MTTANENDNQPSSSSAIDGFDYWLDKQISHFNPKAPSGELVMSWLQKVKEQYQNVKEDHQAETKAAYSKGASDIAEQAKYQIRHLSKKGALGMWISWHDALDVLDELLSQYKQEKVEVEGKE